MNQSLAVVKSILANVHSDPSAWISLSIDASGSHVGAVLQQEVSGFWAPLAYYSNPIQNPAMFHNIHHQQLQQH